MILKIKKNKDMINTQKMNHLNRPLLFKFEIKKKIDVDIKPLILFIFY